jgi:hypothetical protein
LLPLLWATPSVTSSDCIEESKVMSRVDSVEFDRVRGRLAESGLDEGGV